MLWRKTMGEVVLAPPSGAPDGVRVFAHCLRGKPGGKVWKFAGQATVEGDLAAEAEFTAMIDMPKA